VDLELEVIALTINWQSSSASFSAVLGSPSSVVLSVLAALPRDTG
jgi:hypothetical protein